MQKNPSTAAEAAKRRAPARELLTKALLDAKLGVRPHRQSMIWDSKEPGLSVLVSRGPKDKKQATLSFRVVYYLKSNPGKPRYLHLGRYPEDFPAFTKDTLQKVRDRASEVRIEARRGGDPKHPKPTGTFGDQVNRFIEEHAKQNRTCEETERIFKRYVTLEWADKNIGDIEKGDVSELLGKIERGRIDINGKSAARRQWPARPVLNWSPCSTGGRPTSPQGLPQSVEVAQVRSLRAVDRVWRYRCLRCGGEARAPDALGSWVGAMRRADLNRTCALRRGRRQRMGRDPQVGKMQTYILYFPTLGLLSSFLTH